MVKHALGLASEAQGRVQPVPALFIRQRKYDETNSVVSCWWGQGDFGLPAIGELFDREIGPTKIFATETQSAMVFTRPEGEGAEHWTGPPAVAFSWSNPATLRAVQQNTGECYTEALTRVCSQPYDEAVDLHFRRQIDVACHDAHSANFRAERMLSSLHPGTAKLSMVCDAHKAAAIPTKVFDIWKDLPSNIIRLALATKGSISALRRAMRQIVIENLVITGGVSTRDATQFREDMVRLFLPDDKAKNVKRRILITELFNGDWRQLGRVVHHSTGKIPCGDEGIRAAFLKWGIPSLLPRSLKVFARNNWTGSGAAIRDIGLLVSAHGLLQAAFARAFRGQPDAGPTPVVLPAAAALGDEGAPADGEAEGGREEPMEDWVGGQVAPEARPEQVATEDWKKLRQQHISGTRKWLQSGSICDELIIGQTIFGPYELVILKQLAVAGSEWEAREQDSQMKTGSRKLRPLVAHDDESIVELFCEIDMQLFDSSHWRNLRDRTQRAQRHLFKLASRGATAAYQLIRVRHRGWPYRLWDILRPGQTVYDLLFAPECTLDEYAANFRSHYALGAEGAAGQMELRVVGEFAHTDTSSTERIHSVNQRRMKHQVWTHRCELTTLGSWFLANCHSRQAAEYARHMSPVGSQGPSGSPAASSGDVAMPLVKKHKGGGGPWRAFLHVHAKGQKLSSADFSALSARYKALSDTDKEYYNKLGSDAADVHRSGLRSFGKRERVDQLFLQVGHAAAAGLPDEGTQSLCILFSFLKLSGSGQWRGRCICGWIWQWMRMVHCG